MIRAIIFDFDGLILDTELPEYQAWQEIYHEHGSSLPLSLWVSTIGTHASEHGFDPVRFLENQIGQQSGDGDALWAQHKERSTELIAMQPVLPGVEAWIGEARRLGIRLAVASSSPRAWVHGHLCRLGLLQQFDAIRTSEDVSRTKPAPDLFLAALEALGVEPSEAVVIEDSPNGVTAAKRAGIFAIAVPNDLTRQLDLSRADLTVSSLADFSLSQLMDMQQARPAS